MLEVVNPMGQIVRLGRIAGSDYHSLNLYVSDDEGGDRGADGGPLLADVGRSVGSQSSPSACCLRIPRMTGLPDSADGLIDIVLTADGDDPVALIVDSLVERSESPRPRRGVVSEHAQMLIAGSISARMLAAGLLQWVRAAKGATVFVDMQSEWPKRKVFKVREPFSRGVIVLHRDGSEHHYAADSSSWALEEDLEDPEQ